jgi:hypothetical protein
LREQYQEVKINQVLVSLYIRVKIRLLIDSSK